MKKITVDYKKLIYPAILAVIIIVVIAAALLVIKFLTSNINSSFNPDESVLRAGLIKLDMENYKLTAKKLGIQYPSIPDEPTTKSIPSEEQQ